MRILTFDIEDWYNCDFNIRKDNWNTYEVRIYSGVDRILESLSSRNIKATFFCLGWIAKYHPNILRKIHDQGHHIGCHSYQHDLLYNFNSLEFKNDTEKAKKCIEDVIGKPINAYRAPGFSIRKDNSWALNILYELGYDFDCSVFSAKHDFGGFPDLNCFEPSLLKLSNGGYIKEFPINFYNYFGNKLVFSGGGYFRLLPYYIIKNLSRKSNYLMTYFHPRDFDFKQPILESLSLTRKFKSYVGLYSSFYKFQNYIDDFNFIDLESADKLINWQERKKINLM